MTVGQMLYKYFFKPTFPLRYNLSHFGLKGSIKMLSGERAMKNAAIKEPSITLSTNEAYPVFCFLTGDKYWHQTIYAIKSLHIQLGIDFKVHIYSDGSLKKHQIITLKRFAHAIKIIIPDVVTKHLDEVLPKVIFRHCTFYATRIPSLNE